MLGCKTGAGRFRPGCRPLSQTHQMLRETTVANQASHRSFVRGQTCLQNFSPRITYAEPGYPTHAYTTTRERKGNSTIIVSPNQEGNDRIVCFRLTSSCEGGAPRRHEVALRSPGGNVKLTVINRVPIIKFRSPKIPEITVCRSKNLNT